MEPTPPARGPHRAVRRTRVSSAWVASIVAALVLILLLIFIAQNSRRVNVSFLGAHGQLPLGVALLLAAASGILLVAIPGTARIMQLRRATRRAAVAPAPEPRTQRLPGEGPVGEADGLGRP